MATKPVENKPVRICDTILRDAHQSLVATRMTTEEMLPALELLDQVGYHSLEMWGGATFDSCLRFLNEDPWERLRTIRKACKNTKLQMLLRGQNLLGYKHYPDDVVEAFVKKSVENGIDIIRIFDALNDLRNLETAMRATKEAGAHAQGTVVYTISPVHSNETFVDLAVKLQKMGADSICIKDMAGLLKPYVAYDLIRKMKRKVKLPIELHTHCTSGMASMMYLKAIEAGCDIVDTALSPFSQGSSQPATESLVATLQDTPYDTGLDLKVLKQAADIFRGVKQHFSVAPVAMEVDTEVLSYQIPGGMLSNLMSQLNEQGAGHRYYEVLEELPRVREDLGWPSLVTPTSQMVGTQAVLNVLSGARYKMVPKEVKDYVRGYYGATAAPIKEEVRKQIIGDEEPITCRPADKLEPMMETYKKEIAGYIEQEEDVLSYALFPAVAKKFFQERAAKKYGVDNNLVESSEPGVYPA